MITAVLTLLAPALAVAMLVLTLILAKGDICPGQRGRIHKLLPAVGILWLAIASLKVEAFLVVFAIFILLQGPDWQDASAGAVLGLTFSQWFGGLVCRHYRGPAA
ncbi:hypothetical protein JCM19239_574 [Vibrio variabilis]|uniref:Uncharacterized protein n=1 Tax=Vibrio variabilis TaxID=990271 RepID=A0ABQ0JA33_9VIBR|nr:hypothetical protein JCM19239_574 [Vibrio variabilis]